MSKLEAARCRYPIEADRIDPYVRRVTPSLDVSRLRADFYLADERVPVNVAVTGDASLLLRYKTYEVAVASWGSENGDLRMMQLQGARSKKSYRGSRSVDWAGLFSDETLAIAQIPETGISRVTMSHPLNIEGVDGQASDGAIHRYWAFIHYLSLVWSDEESLFIKDVK